MIRWLKGLNTFERWALGCGCALLLIVVPVIIIVLANSHSADWQAGYNWAGSDPASVSSYVTDHGSAVALCQVGAAGNAGSGQSDFVEGCLARVHEITGK